MLIHHLIRLLGLNSANSKWYLFWSGFGGDISELAILGYVITWYRQHKSHMAIHRKYMESKTELRDQSLPVKKAVWLEQDTDE